MSRLPLARLAAFFFAGFLAVLAQAAPEGLDNDTCMGCHGIEGFEAVGADGKPRSLFVSKEKFEQSVHAPRDCVNCHVYIKGIPHEFAPGSTHDKRKLEIVNQGCGGCHDDKLKTYRDTYHGQVTALGYAYTAKCFDCHASDSKHDIQRVSDPRSTVHPDNRLKTCQKCHANATPGFVTFQPHAHAHDFAKYPQVWITQKFMIQLLAGTFAFFWLHSALWFYREYRDRKEGKSRAHVLHEALPAAASGKHVRRFHWLWRLAHLLFALSLMVLTLTGMTVLYAQSPWAPYVADFFGGPRVTAIIHRCAAVLFATIFFTHLIYIVMRIARNWRTFQWFGSGSLVPRWQDLKDMIAMFKWFFGKGPRPIFDRWTYWEKFDYWAPFWGVTIIGTSGFMMWFPELTASFLPGWVFNVAMIAHGEEAFLAAVFLFTVHFFNNHFRPDKFPIDILMFTGTMTVEEFAHDHTIEYRRLVESGELDKYLVDAPSKPMTTGSKILGFTLITAGLSLLVLVLVGFFS
jgi:cytochrome b subunit of formate dehydrogenase